MKRGIILLGMVLCMAQGHAQNHQQQKQQSAFDKFWKSVSTEFDDFEKLNEEEFDRFRQKIMDEFIAFVREPWKEFKETKPQPLPKEDDVPPVVMPKEDQDKPVEDKPVLIDSIIAPVPVMPEPQPTPIVPIKVVPVEMEKTVSFTFFGTLGKVRFDTDKRIVLKGVDENSIADGLKSIRQKDYDNMLIDCLALRKDLKLSDWAHLQMLKALADRICGKGTNESALTLAYLYMQSGYKMRIATDGYKLYMLYASKHQLWEQAFHIDGDIFYGLEQLPSRLFVSQAAFPKEQEMSLWINSNQLFAQVASTPRTVTSEKYPTVKFSTSVNKNLIDFYSTYPTSMVDDDFMTRWAMYANTPMDKQVAEQVYPSLRTVLKGLTQLETANRLLDLIQTGMEYEYDNKLWGHDRAFFAEESIFYPYCDCEDRSILYTRLVRDLMGLDCILIYYPGHLACAVAFTEDVKGDYIMLDGRKFVVTDPTYIGAPVGTTMPEMDNKTANVIILQ